VSDEINLLKKGPLMFDQILDHLEPEVIAAMLLVAAVGFSALIAWLTPRRSVPRLDPFREDWRGGDRY